MSWESGFLDAYEALSSPRVDLIKRGIEYSIAQQRAIVRVGSVCMSRKQYRSGAGYRYLTLTPSPDTTYFTRPLSLCKLAIWFVDAIYHSKRDHKPFLLANLDSTQTKYLVVGVANTHKTGGAGSKR